MTRAEKQRRIVEFIRDYIDRHGYSPTYREIAIGSGYRVHTGVVAAHLHELRERGAVTFVDGQNRTVRVTGVLS